MKYILWPLLIPSAAFSFSNINCDTVERYNDQRIEKSFSAEIDGDVAFKQVHSERDSKIVFVVYYSKDNDVFGARINDQVHGTQSGSFIEPSHELGLIKVRYIKNIPEAQLFAIDCALKK